ncbi:hypothetical protein NSA19_12850 [Actinomyces bowdenii]|uniref:hypothetical protein n=1 Tax=Actinomyces bowdenii TaxID=131109 RepID=UPI00214C575A|nr:hypothetical protein [Actinomyces bowdenii]MCR2053709.1 hypothetical protein [Actinomyces bowdenii]
MATKIVIDIEALRGVAGNMRTLATRVEGKKDTLYSRAMSLDTVGTSSLSTVAEDVQSLKDHATALDARVDLAILHNSGDGKNVPETGTISYTVEGEDSAEPEDVERELGVAIADLGDDIATSDYQEGDPRVELLRSKMQTWNANANVMGATFDSWGPEGTLAVTTAVGDHLGFVYDASEEQTEIAQKTLELVKSGLGTATQEWSDAKAEQFGRDMVDTAVRGYSSPEYQRRFGVVPPRDAMAYIAYENTSASGAFVLGAIEQATIHEKKYRELTGQEEGSGLWGYSASHPPQFLQAMVGGINLDQAMDIPANLLGDLAHHPEESFRFFDEDHERAEYWVIDRKYKDDFNAIGEALETASTDPRVRYNHSKGAAEVAALAINGLGSRSDFGESGQNPPGGMAAADSVGRIVSTYVEGMNRSITDGDTSAQPWDLKSYRADDVEGSDRTPLLPKFDSVGLGNVLNVIGRDGGAFLELRRAQNAYQEEVIRPGMGDQQFKDAAEHLGKVEGFVARTIGTGEIKDAQAHDAHMKAWIELGGKSASEIAGIGASYAPPGVGTAISWGSNQLINDLAKKAESSWANTTAGTVAEQNRQAEVAQNQFVRSLLMSADADGLAGYQNGEKPLSAATYDEDGHLVEGNPAAVENPDGTFRLMTRQEYDTMVSEVQNMSKKDGETDTEFNARKEAAQKRLDEVNSDLYEIAGDESGYLNMITVGESQRAYKDSFLDFYSN